MLAEALLQGEQTSYLLRAEKYLLEKETTYLALARAGAGAELGRRAPLHLAARRRPVPGARPRHRPASGSLAARGVDSSRLSFPSCLKDLLKGKKLLHANDSLT